jgi:hypothetical protein
MTIPLTITLSRQKIRSLNDLIDPRARELASQYHLSLQDIANSQRPQPRKGITKSRLNLSILNPYYNMIMTYAAYAALNFEFSKRPAAKISFSDVRGSFITLPSGEIYESDGEHAMYYLGYYIRKQLDFIESVFGLN